MKNKKMISLLLTSLVVFNGCSFNFNELLDKFKGNTNSNSSTLSTKIEESTSSSSILDEEYEVTYVLNNGEPNVKRIVEAGSKMVTPGFATKQYYELEGWYTDEACTLRRWNFGYDVVTEDMTLYAKWTVDFDDWIWRLARIASKQTVMYMVYHYKTQAHWEKGTPDGSGAGSGVVIAKEKDPKDNKTYFYALTNNHVVSYAEGEKNDDNQEHMVKTYKDVIHVYDHYNNKFSGELIAKTNKYDLALVRFENMPISVGHWSDVTNDPEVGIKVAEFDTKDPEAKYDVSAYGAPLAQPHVCTIGTITDYVNGTISQNDDGVSYITDFKVIEHTADILGGNSGGPLFGPDLKLVGINYGSSGPSDTYNTSDKFWAIPISKVKEFIRDRDNYLVNDVFADRFDFLDVIAKA